MNPDWEYLERARNGDESAWRVLAERHQSRLLAMSLLITGSSAAAQDIAQESLVRLFRSEIRHHSGTVGGLLTTIAFRLSLKEKSRQRRQSEIGVTNPVEPSPSPLESLLFEERDRHIAEVIRSLDEGHRNVLALRFYGGHSYAEIAELMHVPPGTVKSRMFYAVKICQIELRKRGILE